MAWMVAACGLATGAIAQDSSPPLTIAAGDCATLVAHHADDTVAYRPGVDVDGRPAAPADLPGHEPLTLSGEDVAIDPRIPLDAYLTLPASLHPILADAEIGVGLVTLRDGVAYLGERPLGDPAQAALAEACAALREALP